MSDKGLIAEAREACEMKYFKGTYQAGLIRYQILDVGRK